MAAETTHRIEIAIGDEGMSEQSLCPWRDVGAAVKMVDVQPPS
jgi:hypothetical protein